MYTHKIIRIAYGAPCLAGFFSILLLGELLGAFAALWDRDWSGLVGGAFFGLIGGVLGSALILIFLFVFNLFIPLTNGISIRLEAPDSAPAADSPPKQAAL